MLEQLMEKFRKSSQLARRNKLFLIYQRTLYASAEKKISRGDLLGSAHDKRKS